MKIAIPVDFDKNIVCVTFGRAPFFGIKDTETGDISYIENPATKAQGGAGIKAAQAVVDSGASALITVRLGGNSAEILNAADIKIFKAEGIDVKANFNACEQGKLSVLTKFHSGYQGIR